MRFAGATFEKGKPRGRLHTEGYATLHNADGGRCLLDPKLIPVYTPGPASVYAVFNLPRARASGMRRSLCVLSLSCVCQRAVLSVLSARRA